MRTTASLIAIVGLLAAGRAISAESLTLVERAVSDKVVEVGSAKGDALGNLLVFANPVYGAGNRIKVGSDQGYCIRVVPGHSWECFWTLMLKGGQITTEGPFYDKADSVLTITGGTGKYAGAKGKLLLHARDPLGATYDFKYEIL